MSTSQEQDRYYSPEEIADIEASLGGFPGFTPPSTGGLDALDAHIAWQTRNRKKDLKRYQRIYDKEPFKHGALDYAQQTLGNAPSDISDYFAKRGIDAPGNISGDIGTTAGTMHTEAQRKIMSKAKQLQIATLQQMLGHVGDPSAGMAGIASAGLASDQQSQQVLAQGYQNALAQMQMENPVPQLWEEQSSNGLFGALGGIAGGIGGFFLGGPMGAIQGASLGYNTGSQF